MIDIPLNLGKFDKNGADLVVLTEAINARATAFEFFSTGKYVDALERIVAAMKSLREFSDYDNTEFRALLAALLFDLTEVHYALKDYKQAEKELETLFKVLDPLMRTDADRFGQYHILAMELSTRILRSRKKAMDMLVKQQILAGQLYEKVNQGVVAATDKLVESLRKVGELLASSGDYRGAMKFIAEAIKISKKRAGRVTRKEVKMTIEMAEIMMRINQMRPRAKRLLNAILPHAIALETLELEEQILALNEILDNDELKESKWKSFMHKLTQAAKKSKEMAVKKVGKSKKEDVDNTEH